MPVSSFIIYKDNDLYLEEDKEANRGRFVSVLLL